MTRTHLIATALAGLLLASAGIIIGCEATTRITGQSARASTSTTSTKITLKPQEAKQPPAPKFIRVRIIPKEPPCSTPHASDSSPTSPSPQSPPPSPQDTPAAK